MNSTLTDVGVEFSGEQTGRCLQHLDRSLLVGHRCPQLLDLRQLLGCRADLKVGFTTCLHHSGRQRLT
jgi:hypothetical protein